MISAKRRKMKYEGERQIVDLWLESFEEFLIGTRERDRERERTNE